MTTDAIASVRGFFLLSAASVLFANALPPARDRFVTYGVRRSPSEPKDSDKDKNREPRSSLLSSFLDYLATLTVPHSYFTHFYVVSVASSLLWLHQLLTRGPLFRLVADHVPVDDMASSMTLDQVVLGWTLLFAHGARRLYESVVFKKKGGTRSRMWIGHWLVGIAFYLVLGIAVWIEGTPTLLAHPAPTASSFLSNVARLRLPRFTPRSVVLLPLFALASGVQHDTHHYLASLPPTGASQPGRRDKSPAATLPEHPNFGFALCPHYTAEIVVYVALAGLLAPSSSGIGAAGGAADRGGGWRLGSLGGAGLVNVSLMAALAFVAVNLGVTAEGTRRWYVERLGEEKMRGRKRLVPGVW
ncbi:protein DFG10 [Lineolata rhizophorae]|uniref:Polyprenal reductase n=1 Tax=Lineolata rhizophorae TaxID=578093 RepID=A0A6A6NWR2_9PEZI|nr:protein DFG10 [Lineolata rhizophorae]